MPLINHHPQFAGKVEDGTKRQAICPLRKRPIELGDTLYHYTGIGTKTPRKLKESACMRTFTVIISTDFLLRLSIDEVWLDDIAYTEPKEILNAILDRKCMFICTNKQSILEKEGFHSERDMLDWVRKTHGFPFIGQLIRW